MNQCFNHEKTALSLLLCLLLLMPLTVSAKFRALLIGINYQAADPNITPLKAALNDVRDLEQLMTKTLGIPATDIKVLREQQATRAGIKKALNDWLLKGTKAGDTILLVMAGHGVQVPDPFQQQSDDPVKQLDAKAQEVAEAFVPYDAVLNRTEKRIAPLLYDAEIHAFLQKLKDREVLLWLDYCHSGGSTRKAFSAKPSTRRLILPWDFSDTQAYRPEGVKRGLARTPEAEVNWQPFYQLFAAVHYNQEAYEYPLRQPTNGAMTYSLLKLLRHNPQVNYSNQQILDYSRQQLREFMQIAPESQQPVFYGSAQARTQLFPLLKFRRQVQPVNSAVQTTSDKTTKPLALFLAPSAHALRPFLETQDFIRLGQQEQADLWMEAVSGQYHLYQLNGHLLAKLPLEEKAVLQALSGHSLSRQLQQLENPLAPFSVELWLDKVGKTDFQTQQKVTLFYRVKQLPENKTAYLTLLNLAPDGRLSILYPSGETSTDQFNTQVQSQRLHSLPKSADQLATNQAFLIDQRLQLASGREQFIAIVSHPAIQWSALKLSFSREQGTKNIQQGRLLLQQLRKQLDHSDFWASSSLSLNVR